MHNLEQLLVLVGVLILFILISVMKKYLQHPLAFAALLPPLGLALAVYVAFSQYQLKQYHKRAFQASDQIRDCGVFTQWAEIQHQTRQGMVSEKAFYFFTGRQGFIFSNSKEAKKKFPLLKTLELQDRVCFQFSTQFKDRNGYYILTDVQKK